MPRKIKKFYEVLQKTGSNWTHVGFFTTKKAAEEYCKEFNTLVEISPVKITEREFLE
jgi:hypothetical protein